MVCYHEHWTIVAQTADYESCWNFIIFDIPASVYDGMQVVYSLQLCLYSGDAPIQTESNSDSELAVDRLMPCTQHENITQIDFLWHLRCAMECYVFVLELFIALIVV